jgi:hypothetical protein
MNNYAKHMGFNPPTSVQIITLVPRELLYTQNSFLLYILLNAQNLRLKKITKQYYH